MKWSLVAYQLLVQNSFRLKPVETSSKVQDWYLIGTSYEQLLVPNCYCYELERNETNFIPITGAKLVSFGTSKNEIQSVMLVSVWHQLQAVTGEKLVLLWTRKIETSFDYELLVKNSFHLEPVKTCSKLQDWYLIGTSYE